MMTNKELLKCVDTFDLIEELLRRADAGQIDLRITEENGRIIRYQETKPAGRVTSTLV